MGEWRRSTNARISRFTRTAYLDFRAGHQAMRFYLLAESGLHYFSARTRISVWEAVFKMPSQKVGTVPYLAMDVQRRVWTLQDGASSSTPRRDGSLCYPVKAWRKVLIACKGSPSVGVKVYLRHIETFCAYICTLLCDIVNHDSSLRF